VGRGASSRTHLIWVKRHLTLPLLRNGPLPLPHYVAERDSEQGVWIRQTL